MVYAQYSAKAPGSFMLLGEHAVLRGKFAVVCAANQWITITLTPHSSHYIEIISPVLGEYKTDIKNLIIQPPFQFILGALIHFKHLITSGCSLYIESEFSHQIGLGSSAAVTVATIAVLSQWLNQDLSKQELFLKARQVIRDVQGLGSGADIAASIYGGVIAYRSEPVHIEKLPLIDALHLIYCGYKTPTQEVVSIINNQYKNYPEFYDHLFECIGSLSQQAVQFIKEKKWNHLGSLMKIHHSLQKALGTSDPVIDDIVYHLDQEPEVVGSKISGSGLGDCVVALGNINPNTFPKNELQIKRQVKQFAIDISDEGLNFAN